MTEDRPNLEMVFDINVLEHLGLKMYTSLPAVIAEFVANSWDAGATIVDVTIPERPFDEGYSLEIKDNGFGMTVDEVNQKFLVVGRNRRREEGIDKIEVNGRTRHLIGRKGLGKLAGFGVAGQVGIHTYRDGQFVEFIMDYDKMRERASDKEEHIKTKYSPEVKGWGPTNEENGTIIKLSKLKRKHAVSISILRRNLARHFSIVSEDFVVNVNGEPLTPTERDLKKRCEFTWEIVDEEIEDGSSFKVSGWIGTMEKTVPSNIDRGIIIMARGKLVQTPTTFDVGGMGVTGQIALAYLVGEIHADFLDDEDDLISTGRRSILWEKEPVPTLRLWANETIKRVCREWTENRREKKLTVIQELPKYKDRVANLPSRERKIIDSFLIRMAGRDDIDTEAIERLADFLAGGVEYKAFLDLMEVMIVASVDKPEILFEFFKEWEVLDAIEMIRLVEGRLLAIQKFKELVRIRAKEVPTLHDFLVDNPWLLDPTWDYMDDEVDYSNKLSEMFPESEDVPEVNRRIDFLCLGHGSTLTVIELKRPGSSLGMKEMRQLQNYVFYVRTLRGTDPERAYLNVVGYLIGGHISRTPEVIFLAKSLREDSMYVRTFIELHSTTRRVYRRFIEILERKATRINDRRLLDGLQRMKRGFIEDNLSEK